MNLVLFGNRESGHSYKVALALRLLELGYEYRAVDLALPRPSRGADFRAAARFNEVPTLVADGAPIVQSNAILLYLSRLSRKLHGSLGPDRLLEWLFWESNRIGFSVPNLRVARHFMSDAEPALVSWLETRAQADLDRLEQEFATGAVYLAGEEISIADISCAGYLFWPGQAGIDLSRWPSVSAWIDRIRQTPGWSAPYDLLA